MFKTNYHTHSDFCDGKSSVEEMVKKAIQKDFKIIGISSHSMYPFASSWHIAPRDFEAYAEEVRRVKAKYEDKITVLLGFEADYIPSLTIPSYERYKKFSPDYLIGSVHYIFTEKGRLCVDYSAEKLQAKISELFNGDAKKMVCEYFYLQRELLKKCDFTILGHADLVRKNNPRLAMFNECESWYKKELKATAREIAKSGVVVEVNTGAIARGYFNDTYPSKEFLSLLQEYNVPVTLSSDCHNADLLDCAFDQALENIKTAGYKELAYIDAQGEIKFQKI